MSAGPIRAWRDSWLPERVTTKAADRICYKSLLASKAYCGRTPKIAFDDWRKVTCSECLAANRADNTL